jgi:acetolactate synthase I/II/III large subunit
VTRTGGQVVVDQLALHGVEHAFCVPGESYLPVLDALHDANIRLISCRHEAAAANMAEAYGKLTGRPGVCLVTRGPGSTHASVGVHIASQDSTPMILLVGQVPRRFRGREAFQELDYGRLFGEMAKWVVELDGVERIPEFIARAFHVASSGRPGPVVVAMPEDVLALEGEVADAMPSTAAQASPPAAELAQARHMLASAERPLVIVGGGGWTAPAADDLRVFAESSRLPVATSFRRQDYVDNGSPSYVGVLTIGQDPALARRVEDADVLCVIGSRLGEIATAGYTTVEAPRPRQRLIHVHADAVELGRVYEPDLPIVSGSPQFLAAARGVEPLDGARWEAWTSEARADYLANLRHEPGAGFVDLGNVMKHLRDRLADDAILTNGAGNYTVWAHRFYEFHRYRTQLAPCSGAMGYGVPAAIAAKIVHPERDVVCLSGDGDFLMSGHELAAARQEQTPIVVLVANNGMYGTIRMHQERQFPARVIGTDLVNPSFVDLGRAYGAYAELVEHDEDFPDALDRALDADRPALIELRVDPEAITPRATISAIRAGAG